MLTRCPACATHFRVTPEQLKTRSGRVRCGECREVFNALDSLVEEPVLAMAPPQRPPLPVQDIAASPEDAGTATVPARVAEEIGQLPAASAEIGAEATEIHFPPLPATEVSPSAGQEPALPDEPTESAEFPDAEPAITAPQPEAPTPEEPEAVATDAANQIPVEPIAAIEPPAPEQPMTGADLEADSEPAAWSETFPEPPAAPRRWPWIIGSLIALVVIGVQCALAFRVELAVLWPEGKPALVTLCDLAGCEVALPAKVSLVGIEASDLHPDTAQPDRLILTATLKNRAPFAQQFPHLELTLTDTADKAVARKVLAPADYLSAKAPVSDGMPAGADVAVAVGVEARDMTASGYRLYLFYP